MYSTFNEGKSVVAEIFIKTLKNKIYKHMTTIGKNVYIDVLDDIVKKYSNTVHSSIKMKPKDVTDVKYVEYSEETNKKGPNIKIFLLKVIHLIGQKKFLLLIKYRTLFLGLI